MWTDDQDTALYQNRGTGGFWRDLDSHWPGMSQVSRSSLEYHNL